jgi:hypothetical protein
MKCGVDGIADMMALKVIAIIRRKGANPLPRTITGYVSSNLTCGTILMNKL